MKFKVSMEVDGVRMSGEVVALGRKIGIRIDEPYRANIVVKRTRRDQLWESETNVKARAMAEMAKSYRKHLERLAERDSKTSGEWARILAEIRARVHALNVRLKLVHDVMMGTAKSDLNCGQLRREEYLDSLLAFRERTREERAEVARLQNEMVRVKFYLDTGKI